MKINPYILLFLSIIIIIPSLYLLKLLFGNKNIPGHTNKTDEDAVLYLLPETGGFGVDDIELDNGYLIDPTVVKNNFKKIAVIANMSIPSWKDMYTEPNIKNLLKASNLSIEKWVTIYMAKDGSFCRCQRGTFDCTKKSMNNQQSYICGKQNKRFIDYVNCDGSKSPCNTCKEKDELVQFNINECDLCNKDSDGKNNLCLTSSDKYPSVVDKIYSEISKISDLSGIMYDDEEGDPKYIIQAFEAIKDKWDKNHTNKLKLGWTLAVNSCHLKSPKNYPSKYIWDVSLGQAYTNTTADTYTGVCGEVSNTWWKTNLDILEGCGETKGVPMVCGSGNCIGDMTKSGKIKCTDERMSGKAISNLISLRPSTKYTSFAVWYGTYSKSAGCGCANKDDSCSKGCCTSWLHNGSVC